MSVCDDKAPKSDENKGKEGDYKAPFDAGIQTRPPVTYKEPMKTVQTPVTTFEVDNKKHDEKKPIQVPASSKPIAVEAPKQPAKEQPKPIAREEPKQPPKPIVREEPKPIVREEPKPQPKEAAKPMLFGQSRQANALKQVVTPASKPAPIMLKDLKHVELTKEKHNVAILGGSVPEKLFFVVEASEGVQQYLTNIAISIDAYVKQVDPKPYKPIVGEVVLAKFEETYCRAAVQEIDGAIVSILYIDYGEYAQVGEKEVLPLPKELCIDVVAVQVLVVNMPNEEDLTPKQIEILQGAFITVEGAVKQPDGIYKVTVVGL